MLTAGFNFLRAYRRMLTRAGRRRMFYLMARRHRPGARLTPYMLFGYNLAEQYPGLLDALDLINIAVGILMVVMAYAGPSWASPGRIEWPAEPPVQVDYARPGNCLADPGRADPRAGAAANSSA